MDNSNVSENISNKSPPNMEDRDVDKKEVSQQHIIEMPELVSAVEPESKHNEEMPSLEPQIQIAVDELQVTNNTIKAVESADKSGTTLLQKSENAMQVESENQNTSRANIAETKIGEKMLGDMGSEERLKIEDTNVSQDSKEPENVENSTNAQEASSVTEVQDKELDIESGEINVDNIRSSEIGSISVTEVTDNPEFMVKELSEAENNVATNDKQEEFADSDAIAEIEFQEVTDLAENEYAVEEEVIVEQNSNENMKGEAATPSQIITTREELQNEEQSHPVITEIGDHILIENDINFTSEEAKDTQQIEESATVEYVVLNDNESAISVNGISQLPKEEVDEYESIKENEEKLPFTSQTIEAISISSNDIQNPENATVISCSEATEITYTDVQVLETSEGLVTVDELGEQSEEQIVILQDENVVLEENEAYNQLEPIEVKPDSENNQIAEQTQPKKEEQEEVEKSVKIPCHVLGRNIENPLEDHARNGRMLLKPRLGVKIPYRNLTSQIVSKQDIANEIMERSRLRQSSAEPPVGGDVFFAKKLTQRLAKKLTSPTKTTTKTISKTNVSASSSSQNSNKKVTNSHKTATKLQVLSQLQSSTVGTSKTQKSQIVSSTASNNSKNSSTSGDTSGKITNNSDLIALLEGDGDTDWPVGDIKNDINKKKTDVLQKKSSDWERETALRQLRELPFKSKINLKNTNVKEQLVQSQSLVPPSVDKDSVKQETLDNVQKDDSIDDKDDLNIEPRFSSSTVMKTYTRKRKPSEDILKTAVSAALIQSPKRAAVVTEHKQSPVIKQSSAGGTQKHASDQKHGTSTPQKLTSQKLPSTPTSSDSINAQKVVLKSLANTHKSSSSTSLQKSSSNTSVKPTSMPNLHKVASTIQKSPVFAKKPSSASNPKSASVNVESKSESSEMKNTFSPNTYISKSSRIIKKKKIWDPDEATPLSKTSPAKQLKLQESVEKSPEKKINKSVAILKSSNEKGIEKSISPVPKMVEKKLGKPITILKPNNDKLLPKKITMKKVITKKKKPKRLTEVDRLLMDEGAVNLLYSVKNTEEEVLNLKKRKKKNVISLDRAHRELLNKTNEIKNELQINSTKDSPISLRKKELNTSKTSPAKDLAATILHRKKSKDSVHSPPASPAYGYSHHAEASRIIRRHSSSSFSSEDNEDDENETNVEKVNKHKIVGSESPKKKLKVNHDKSGRGTTSIGVDKQLLSEEMSKNFNKLSSDDPKYSKFEMFNVRRFDNLVQIILTPDPSSGYITLSAQTLAELALALDILHKDAACRVVLLSSSGNSFCHGIDYKELVSENKTECESTAENYAVCVRNFLMSLSKCCKILVAGVHGNAIGLGVTMLPLFDMVLASDTATFSTPYAQLGCAAEGGVLLTLPHVMHNALASELFFASRKLTAAEALRLGLVTRTLWPDKFQEELISALKIISSQSIQSMEAIKKQLRHHLLQNVENSLMSESAILVQHWTSTECQSNFNKYSLDTK